MEIEFGETSKNAEKKLQKNVQCENCHKYLSSKKSLSIHIRSIHLGDKNFHCQICENSFLYGHELKSHVRKKHPKDGEVQEIFYCDQCTKQFTNKSVLHNHKKYVHQITDKNYHCALW